jgi:DNA-binding transcriptional LysR family regulator
VDAVNGLIRGRLVVGMVTACTVTPLFNALAAFHRAHPGVEITLIEDNSGRLTERVRAGEADLALIGASGAPPPGLSALPIISERLVAALPPGHPLAGQRRVTLADITAYPIVSMPVGTGIRTVLDQACAAQGIQPDIALQASAPGAVADLAIRGLGVAILSESMAASHDTQLKSLVIDDIQTPAVLALIWAETDSPALRELLQHSRQAFATPQLRRDEQDADRGEHEARPLYPAQPLAEHHPGQQDGSRPGWHGQGTSPPRRSR